MSHFETETRIPRACAEVFAFMADPTHATQIMADVVGIELVTDRVDHVGGQWKETRRMNGKDHTQLLEVSAFEAPTVYAVSTSAEGFDIVYRFTLSERDGETDVHMRCDVTASGLRSLATGMVAMALKKQDGDHLERIRLSLS